MSYIFVYLYFFCNFTQEEGMKPQTALPSISIPQPVWNGAGTSLSDAPWSRGRAALFAEVNVSEN